MATKDEDLGSNKKDHWPWLFKNIHISFSAIKKFLNKYATSNTKIPKNENTHNTYRLNAMKEKNTCMVATKD
jgi:hypothetical protein